MVFFPPTFSSSDLGSINPEVPTGNSHTNNSNSANSVNNKIGNSEGEAKKIAPQAAPRKEKSVLQAKLTRLAIQIGYGGKVSLVSAFSSFVHLLVPMFQFKGLRYDICFL